MVRVALTVTVIAAALLCTFAFLVKSWAETGYGRLEPGVAVYLKLVELMSGSLFRPKRWICFRGNTPFQSPFQWMTTEVTLVNCIVMLIPILEKELGIDGCFKSQSVVLVQSYCPGLFLEKNDNT